MKREDIELPRFEPRRDNRYRQNVRGQSVRQQNVRRQDIQRQPVHESPVRQRNIQGQSVRQQNVRRESVRQQNVRRQDMQRLPVRESSVRERETYRRNVQNREMQEAFSNEISERRRNLREQQLHRSKIEKKRRRRRIKRICMLLAAVVIGHCMARVQLQVESTLDLMNRDIEGDLNNVQVNESTLISEKKVVNILLVGADKRGDWTEPGRSDSVMIATLDGKNKRLKLTSLMRDMYVTIPGHGEDRFNAAYSYGGIRLLYQTIAENFNVKLDGYVIVDFAAFKSVINKIGGVDITLTDWEYNYLKEKYANKEGTAKDVVPGLNTMDGSQALAYTRIRQDAQGDFGRTARQRTVLQAIMTKVKSMSFSELTKLIEKVLPNLTTDITNDEIIEYMTTVLTLGTTTLDQQRIPLDDTYEQQRIRNMAVLVPDMAANRQALQEFLFAYDGEEATEPVVTMQ